MPRLELSHERQGCKMAVARDIALLERVIFGLRVGNTAFVRQHEPSIGGYHVPLNADAVGEHKAQFVLRTRIALNGGVITLAEDQSLEEDDRLVILSAHAGG